MYFDARAAKALAPGAHIVVDGCPGLRLQAAETKKTWTYRYKSPVDGRMKQVRIGGWPELALSAAVVRWEGLRARRDAGEDLSLTRKGEKLAAKVVPTSSYTLGRLVLDYADGYLVKRREAKGALAVRQRLLKAIDAHKSTPVAMISRSMAFELIEGLSDRPVMANSVKAELAAALDYALDAGRVPDDTPNWWRQVFRKKLRSLGALRDGKRKGTGKRVLTADEVRMLLTDDLPMFSQQVQDFLVLQLWTCTRGAEIVQMRPEHISHERDGMWWTVPKEMLKTRHTDAASDLRVPLEGRAAAVVARLSAANGPWLFPSRSRKGEIQAQSQAYMQSKVHYLQPYSNSRPDHIRRRIKVSHWSPHDLRRTGRTWLAALGCPHEVGEAILGHVLPGVAGDYNLYAYDKERRQWLAALSVRLAQVAVGDA